LWALQGIAGLSRITMEIAMFKMLSWIWFVALCFTLALTDATGDAGQKISLAEDLKALQGVWQSSPDAKRQLTIMFRDDKVGYLVTDPAAQPGATPLSFMALSAAQHKEAKGKRSFEIEVAKDYVKRVDYRFEKGKLVIAMEGAEYKVERANARASTNPAAKKLVGTWKVMGIEQKGRKGRAAQAGLEAVVFTEDRYILTAPGGKELLNSFYRLDSGKEPATMDWYGMKPDFIIPLIYELKGDELRLAHPPLNRVAKGARRPTSFDTEKTDTMLIRAERSK
jgi:uncharacterized protein (TIGR03067 family)